MKTKPGTTPEQDHLIDLARKARVQNESDWGTERHTDAFNAFIEACERAHPKLFGPRSDFSARIHRATSDEILDAALERLEVPPQGRPWKINDEVTFPEGFEAYPNFLIRESLSGRIVDLSNPGYVFVRAIPARPELAEWNGLLHVVEDEDGTTPGMIRA